MTHHEGPEQGGRRSIWGTVALAVTAISVLALIALIAGAIAGLEGFEEGEEGTALGSILWVGFSLGAILALIAGLIAFVRGRQGHPPDRKAGQLAIAWFIVAVLAVVVISALDS